MKSSNLNFTDPSTGEDSKSSDSSSANPEITAEQEFCLYELETLSDSSSIGLVLRAIYDSGDVHNFTRALEKRITHYDKNILRVCTHHYQGFLDSLKQLQGLKENCADIRKIAEETNQLVQEESRELFKRSSDIVRYRKLQRNANAAIQQISMCLPMLENYAQLEKLMEQKKYLQALKILEDLEHNYLNQLHKYRFAHHFAKTIGPLRDQIRERSYSELTDFLEHLMKISEKIGEEACKHLQKVASSASIKEPKSSKEKSGANNQTTGQGEMEVLLSEDGSLVKKSVGTSKRATDTSCGPVESALAHANSRLHQERQRRMDLQNKLDFGPIHRCCQIFNVLGDREKFEIYYRKQRRDQIRLVVERQIPQTTSAESFVPYLNEIIGFFVIEDRIAQLQSTLVTEEHKEELWEFALQRVKEAINAHLGRCTALEPVFAMKKVLLVFALATKSYGYNPAAFYLLLQNFRDRYNEVLIRKYSKEFGQALERDEFAPIEVRREEEYREVVANFPVYRRGMEQEGFPKKFPFSRFVPTVYSQAKAFVAECMHFMRELRLSQSEVCDTVRRYANLLFARWSDELRQFVTGKKPSLAKLVQITINMGYLERSCEFLERIIAEAARNLCESGIEGGSSSLSAREDSGHLVALKNQIFRDCRSEVEQLIDEAFRGKVQAFLDNSNYDWELQQPSGVASEYCTDMITFLTSTFLSFTNLPPVLARHICMQTCKFLADRLHSMLLSAENKAVSPGALEQFSLDVMQCELFTAQCPVPGFEDNALAITFAHLRQLLDLVMGPDWSTFFAEREGAGGQKGGTAGGVKYSRVKASNAAVLLEKIIEYEKKNSGFFTMGRGDRHKLYDTILKKLRTFSD